MNVNEFILREKIKGIKKILPGSCTYLAVEKSTDKTLFVRACFKGGKQRELNIIDQMTDAHYDRIWEILKEECDAIEKSKL